MTENLIKYITDSCKDAIPLLIVIRGSKAYGTDTPESDTDYCGVYIQSIDDILGNNYIPQINDDKNDIVFYEVRRFLELIYTSNPNILEMLNTPKDCILYKHPSFDNILTHKESFLTKNCAKSFAGYAIQQIKKAKGQDKKQNWEKDRITRKTPMDFCFYHDKHKSIQLENYLQDSGMDQKFCGLIKVPHSRDTYALYYDYLSHNLFSDKKSNFSKKINRIVHKFLKKNPNIYKFILFFINVITSGAWNYFSKRLLYNEKLGFKGIFMENSNDIRVSSIPKDIPDHYYLGHVSYNKDGYTSHCDDYNSYQKWILNRNESRWVDVKNHDQKIDGKNMMHCRRLIEMAKEIANGEGINVKRSNADELLSIRKGDKSLQEIINKTEKEISEIDNLFVNSNLPEQIDRKLIDNILINIRKEIYNL